MAERRERAHRRVMWRATQLLVFALVLSLCSGCSLVGLGIGAAISRKTTYGESKPAGPALQEAVARQRIAEDDEVVIETKPASPEIGPPEAPVVVPLPAEVAGRFRAIDPQAIHLGGENTTNTLSVPLERVDVAHVSHGSYWAGGMFLGLALDAIWVPVAIVVVNAMSSNR